MKPQRLSLTECECAQLLAHLGGAQNLLIYDESEFLQETGCPREELETWLGDRWISCEIKAVLANKEWVGPEPVLLTQVEEDQVYARLFYPTKELLIENKWAEGDEHMLKAIAEHGWAESAEEIISRVEALNRACRIRELPTIEIKLYWQGLWIAIRALVQLSVPAQAATLGRLEASMGALSAACQERAGDQTPQGKYSEARLNSQRALSENHNPVLDGFEELVLIAKEVASGEVAAYVLEGVGLPVDQYLDAMEMMARDGCRPAEVVNPPARLRAALARKQYRVERLERQRGVPLSVEDTAPGAAPESVEHRVIAEIDWERGKAAMELPEDLVRALEARMNGLSLQAAEAGAELGWDGARLAAVRRSLESDRPFGRKLRRHFSTYHKGAK